MTLSILLDLRHISLSVSLPTLSRLGCPGSHSLQSHLRAEIIKDSSSSSSSSSPSSSYLVPSLQVHSVEPAARLPPSQKVLPSSSSPAVALTCSSTRSCSLTDSAGEWTETRLLLLCRSQLENVSPASLYSPQYPCRGKVPGARSDPLPPILQGTGQCRHRGQAGGGPNPGDRRGRQCSC